MRRSLSLLTSTRWSPAVVALLLLSIACSGPDDGPGRPIDRVEDVGADADADDLDSGQPDADVSEPGDAEDDVDQPDADASEPDADADEADADVDEPDADSGEADVAPPPTCLDAVIDLGVLDSGQHPVTIDSDDATDQVQSACQGEAGQEQVVVRFRVSDDGALRFPGAELALSWADEPCAGPPLLCIDASERTYLVSGRDYVLFVSPEAEPQDLILEFSSFALCDEPDEIRCVEPTMVEACTVSQASPDVPRWYTVPCETGCVDNACGGDSCANPISVSGVYQAELASAAFRNTFGSTEDPCDFGSPSEGREVVFEVQRSQGDTLRVEVEDVARQHRILVLNACSGSAECLANEEGADVLEFSVPEDGTYYVVVDAQNDTPGGMRVTIE